MMKRTMRREKVVFATGISKVCSNPTITPRNPPSVRMTSIIFSLLSD
jgi:hypothetical protein